MCPEGHIRQILQRSTSVCMQSDSHIERGGGWGLLVKKQLQIRPIGFGFHIYIYICSVKQASYNASPPPPSPPHSNSVEWLDHGSLAPFLS